MTRSGRRVKWERRHFSFPFSLFFLSFLPFLSSLSLSLPLPFHFTCYLASWFLSKWKAEEKGRKKSKEVTNSGDRVTSWAITSRTQTASVERDGAARTKFAPISARRKSNDDWGFLINFEKIPPAKLGSGRYGRCNRAIIWANSTIVVIPRRPKVLMAAARAVSRPIYTTWNLFRAQYCISPLIQMRISF